MGIFGGKQKDTGVPSEPGAYQVYGENDENLPVAVPIEATVVRPTAPPDSKKGYGSASNQPLIIKTTTTTTTPPISQQQQQQQPTPVVAGNFRRYPVLMQACPQCQQRARTKTRTFPNIWTWLAMIGVGVIFLPLFWIPLCCDCFKQTDHFCKSCGTKVGTVHAFSQCCEKRQGW
mmetsp:Transcript_14040/g.21650  ORF Transcript_14040/g.21650 Transcript_14040/m.21650 type:complete len:175 (-) Transcript_14040:341-865(-)